MDETQVRWIWAPNSESTWPLAMTSFWPGSDYVDAVGVSAYNLGGEPEDWRSAWSLISGKFFGPTPVSGIWVLPVLRKPGMGSFT